MGSCENVVPLIVIFDLLLSDEAEGKTKYIQLLVYETWLQFFKKLVSSV